ALRSGHEVRADRARAELEVVADRDRPEVLDERETGHARPRADLIDAAQREPRQAGGREPLKAPERRTGVPSGGDSDGIHDGPPLSPRAPSPETSMHAGSG